MERRPLRAWSLPAGSEERLGRGDEAGLGASISFFADDGNSWLYFKDNSLFRRSLPAGQGPDNLLSRHDSEVVTFGYFRDPHRIWVREREGRIRSWALQDSDLRDPVDIPKPETAPEVIRPEPSGRWVWKRDRPSVDLWSLAALPYSRPLALRRSGTWYGASCDVHPSGDWMVCSTSGLTCLTFWPLPERQTSIVDGYSGLNRPAAFSPDSRWLATSWGDGGLRLWPLPGSGIREVRELGGPKDLWRNLVFDPAGRYLFAVGVGGNAWVVPLGGEPPRKMEGFSGDQLLDGCAVSPSGRLVAAAQSYGAGTKTLRVWDVESGTARVFPLPEPAPAPAREATVPRTGYEGGLWSLAFQGESTLFSSGDGGIRRWDLDRGTENLIWEAPPGASAFMSVTGDLRYAFVATILREGASDTPGWKNLRVDLGTGESSSSPEMEEFSRRGARFNITGPVYATSSIDGLVGVGRVAGGPPHLLAGHVGVAQYAAVSPDLRWVASSGEDNTLRLWPMPDLSKPPLQTLPHDELVAKLKSLTNLRAVPDPAAENGWKIELAPFPGWTKVPKW
jgi:WD40 repeat protein